jgi:predicted dinucleotide-binding enzyme
LLASKGIDVAIGLHDPAKAAALAEEIGPRAKGGGSEAAAKLADVVIVAVPFAKITEALKGLGDLSCKIVVDISNPISSDFKSLTIGHNTSTAEEIQRLVPSAKVVKAWNTAFCPTAPLIGAGRAIRSGASLYCR